MKRSPTNCYTDVLRNRGHKNWKTFGLDGRFPGNFEKKRKNIYLYFYLPYKFEKNNHSIIFDYLDDNSSSVNFLICFA